MTTKPKAKMPTDLLTGILFISLTLALVANVVASLANSSSPIVFCAGTVATWFILAAVLIWWCWE